MNDLRKQKVCKISSWGILDCDVV